MTEIGASGINQKSGDNLEVITASSISNLEELFHLRLDLVGLELPFDGVPL